MLKKTKRVLMSTVVTLCFLAWSLVILAQQANPDIAGAIKYRYLGPVGNRVTSVVGVPGQPNIYYVGAASGGIFKTLDGGVHWEPVFDDQPVSSIGSYMQRIGHWNWAPITSASASTAMRFAPETGILSAIVMQTRTGPSMTR